MKKKVGPWHEALVIEAEILEMCSSRACVVPFVNALGLQTTTKSIRHGIPPDDPNGEREDEPPDEWLE